MKIQELSISECIVLAEKLWDSIIDEGAPIELTEKQQVARMELCGIRDKCGSDYPGFHCVSSWLLADEIGYSVNATQG